MQTTSVKFYLDSQGAVLIISLVLLAVMLTLGSLMVRNMGVEINVAGNYETNTRSLFVAEGGLESAKGEISGNVSAAFTADGYSSGNSQEYLVEGTSIPMTTLTNPVNWVGTTSGWYISKTASATSLLDPGSSTALSSTNATWPLYKRMLVGSDYAVVTLERPKWFSSNPNHIRFGATSEADNLANTKLLNRKVAVTFKIDMGNSFLAFQTFSDPSDDQTPFDNAANDFVVIGSAGTHYGAVGAGYDYGVYAASNAVTGVWTYDQTDKTLIIQSCTSGNPGSFAGCTNYGVPELNSNNRTFILGGSGHGCLMGGLASNAIITVTSGNRFKLTYASSVTCP